MMSVLDLENEIDRVEKEIAEVEEVVTCPPSKGISPSVGLLMGLHLRRLVLKDALLFVKKGPPTRCGYDCLDPGGYCRGADCLVEK